jgi:N-acetylglucosamine-6-phosphate deacetylase
VASCFVGAKVFDGRTLTDSMAVSVQPDGTVETAPETAAPPHQTVKKLQGGIVLPGFVDLQVNGGGGAMFNDDPSMQTLKVIAAAHRALGTAAFLPTLITDTAEKTESAIEAVTLAMAQSVRGIAGLHLEGPHLSIARKGAHDAALIRPMTETDLSLILNSAEKIDTLMVTVAPETVTTSQIAALAEAGIIVSLGHSGCDYDTAMAAFNAGASCATHLFNAMSQPSSRTPGLVGAALDHGAAFAGLIADGVHVHPAMIRAALAAKRGPAEIFLVTDAMAVAGSAIESFTLNGRQILRHDGRLTLADGTLAGADLTLLDAIRFMVNDVGAPLDETLARVTTIPAQFLRTPPPTTADTMIWINDDLTELRWLADL